MHIENQREGRNSFLIKKIGQKCHLIFLQAARMEADESIHMELMEVVNDGKVRH